MCPAMMLDFIQSLELLCLVVSLMLELRCCLLSSLGFMSLGGRNIILVKMDEDNRIHIRRGGDDKFTYTFKVTMMVIYCLSMRIQSILVFPMLTRILFKNFFQMKHSSVKE